jgi:hypothetical protein
VVEGPCTGEDGPMPEPVTVWMVRLRRDARLREVRGTLRMDETALVFIDHTTRAETHLPFSETRKVKRVLGSPVLILSWWEGEGIPAETAFYFVQPPPMLTEHAQGQTRTQPTTMLRQPSRRRQRRESIGYLTSRSRVSRGTIKTWADEIRARVRG